MCIKIDSSLISPATYLNQIYCIKNTKIGVYRGKVVYLATHLLKTFSFWKRCLSLIFNSLFALLNHRMASQAWCKKRIEENAVIPVAVAVVIDGNSPSNSLANRVKQAADEYLQGRWYKDAVGCQQDLNKAKNYFEEAAQKENKQAIHQLGLMYSGDWGVEVNHDKAIEYFGKVVALESVQLGGPGSNSVEDRLREYQLNDIYKIGCRYKDGTGGKPVDHSLAKRYLELAAHNGHADAAYQLGWMYYEVLGDRVDHDKTIEYFGKALARDKARLEDIYLIAYQYKEGKNGKRVSYSIVKRYLELAANNGHANATYQLGLMYDEGLGNRIDHDKAIEYFGKAIARDKARLEDIYVMGCHYKNGTGSTKVNYSVAIDYSIAKKYLELAANSGHADAAYQLGLMCRDGLGASVNQVQAKEYFEKAVIWKGGLDLALHHRTQGNMSEAQRLEASHKAFILGHYTPTITHIGGELLTIASNLPDLEEWHRQLNPSTHAALVRERSTLISLLNREGVLPTAEDIPFTKLQGVCTGMTMEFMTHLNNATPVINLESELIRIAQNFESRPGITAVALQSICSELHYRVRNGILTSHTIFPMKAPHLFKLEEMQRRIYSEDVQTALKHLYKVQGQKLVSLPTLGVPGELSETEYLKQWLTSPDGNYEVNIKATANDDYHALAFIKQGGQVYVWDPNAGLIKCSAADPADTIIRYLSTCYPGLDNHHLDIRRIERLIPSGS